MRRGVSRSTTTRLTKALTKYKEAGAKGIPVTVVHEKNVASKVTVIQKKKNAN